MISAVVFVAASVPIVWISRRSLIHPASHGFSRFFGFEAILALFVLNVPHWFSQPFSATQLISWFLLIVSGVFVTWSLALFLRLGETRSPDPGSPLLKLENTQVLITSGIYRYIRHPMYSSLLFLAWGAALKSVTLVTLVLAALSTLALTATAAAEEAENVARFGQEYRDYMLRTRRFVPFLF